MLTSSKVILEKAMKNKTAVPAFNAYNLESCQAIISVAKSLGRDVIIAVSESALDYAGAKNIFGLVQNMSQGKKPLIALHLDHGKGLQSIKAAIDAGFTSVMIDGSALPFKENIALTKKVVSLAHKHNVSVEGELGKIIGTEDIVSNAAEHFTDPLEAQEFVSKTNVDSLAISIGTAHGINKATSTPKIQMSVIDAVRKAVRIPLVAHGSSTVPKELVASINANGGAIKSSQGIDEKDFTLMAKHGINKINVDTDLRLAFTAGVRKFLRDNPSVFDPRKILGAGQAQMQQQIRHIFSLLEK